MKLDIHRFKRRHVEPTFLHTLNEVNHFKELVSRQPCTACGQNGLKLKTFVRNPSGWGAEVRCDNCNFNGIVNSEGFDLRQINSKGKARD